jgi:stage II sporulation protein GA (sporulation sigma-E factor processing peptidase)
MRIYLVIAILLNVLVELLLLLAANRLAGFPQNLPRSFLAAAIGGIYDGACLLPGFGFLGSMLWRCVFLFSMGLAAYGFSKSGIRRCTVFMLLSMALGGIVLGIGDGGILSAIAGGSLFCLISYTGLGTALAGQSYVNVMLKNGQKEETLLALRDTGNTLKDPITGENVLIADAKSAENLLGLTPQQLRSPVETMATAKISGLRLIPYRAVGQSGGMLLGIRLQQVRIGDWQGSALVAFAPEGLGEGNPYRALTGGMV